jgi:hypothetical protein
VVKAFFVNGEIIGLLYVKKGEESDSAVCRA